MSPTPSPESRSRPSPAVADRPNSQRLRVVAYVTRGRELLVFDHADLPEAGTQVPAGRLDPGESLEDGLARELDEEVGIRARVVRELGQVTRRQGDGKVYESHYLRLETDDPRDAWEHVVRGDGDDAGLVFVCRFVPLDPLPELAGRQGEFLHEL
jgi:ADP-ribose pyrophosphatase YjhB (NUDIX family)